MYTAYIYIYIYIYFIRMMGDAKKREVGRYNVAVAIYFRGCGGHVPLCGKSFYFSPPGVYNIYKRLATAVPWAPQGTRYFFFTRLFLLFIFIFQSARNWLLRLKNLLVLLFIHSAYIYIYTCMYIYIHRRPIRSARRLL